MQSTDTPTMNSGRVLWLSSLMMGGATLGLGLLVLVGWYTGNRTLIQVQPWYWFSVGKGYQIGGSRAIVYNWAADDRDQAWTVPVKLGVAKTVLLGKTPVKLKFEGIYYIDQPELFGPHWGLQLTITPVIANPFERLFAKIEG